MTDPDQPLSPDRLVTLLSEADHEKIVTRLDRLGAAETETRRCALQALRSMAEERPSVFDGLAKPLVRFLSDNNRAVRLTAAKLFVTLARSRSTVVLPVVDTLALRLADDEEFYFVRARCAEALGYVALEHPEKVTDPDILADFRVGLSFDEPEVKEKLAKAMEYVALGDPDRLRHQVASLAEHLDDDSELVRYHLCTALLVVGCEHPERLSEAATSYQERLADENPYVRGRAAEALAVLARSGATFDTDSALDEVNTEAESPSFLTDRVHFYRRQLGDDEECVAGIDGVGTIQSVRDGTDEVIADIMAADGAECPHCGLALPDSGPPLCPRCGAPR